ncbi:MAG: tRNA preQ1(34) S-adenosylmethionine ribosyltransferase-isomerase QueA, partial [Steroidobacteraceae bacterium]
MELTASQHVPGTRTADYDYRLDPAQIAQQPSEQRDESRLLIVERASGALRHAHFGDLVDVIPAGDVLVLNTSRVIRARLLGTRESPQGAGAEVLLLKQLPTADERTWEALVHPGGKLKPGRRIHVADDLIIEIVNVTDRRTRIVRLHTSLSVDAALQRYGHVPLPPYITRADEPADAERYQTVYAHEPGSVAAPTAGLHFTPHLLARLEHRGVQRAEVLLHVGAGTFKPVETDDPADHLMHEEWYTIGEGAARAVNDARSRERHIWAVGTTTVRTLETAADGHGRLHATTGETRLFIRPPYT